MLETEVAQRLPNLPGRNTPVERGCLLFGVGQLSCDQSDNTTVVSDDRTATVSRTGDGRVQEELFVLLARYGRIDDLASLNNEIRAVQC